DHFPEQEIPLAPDVARPDWQEIPDALRIDAADRARHQPLRAALGIDLHDGANDRHVPLLLPCYARCCPIRPGDSREELPAWCARSTSVPTPSPVPPARCATR